MSRARRTKTLLFDVREHLRNNAGTYFTKEGLAEKFGARASEVQVVLAQLNREGLCSQARHAWLYPNEPWARDTYVRRTP